MLKKVMMFLVFGMAVTDVWAASSIPNVGGNTVQPMVQNMPQVRKASNNATLTKSVKKPTMDSDSQKGRLAITPIYSFGSTKSVKVPVNKNEISGSKNTQDLTEIINSIQEKTDNMITDVVSNAGTYVTDVAVDGNTLNVNKTRLLYAPVRNSSGDTITGEAEIWIVK